MHILIERLRGTETTGITSPDIDIFRRVKTDIRTRAEYYMIHHIMFIQTTANQEAPSLIFPLILQKCALDMHLLIRKAIIPDHLVFQMIETILQTGSQIRWHK